MTMKNKKEKTEVDFEMDMWKHTIDAIRPKMEKLCRKVDAGFNIDTDRLYEKDREVGKVLLANKDAIIKTFVENGIEEDDENEYTYYVPTGLYFDCGDERYQIKSLWAIVILARSSGARACWLDCDKEGYPELPQFCGGKVGFHRVKITDPFALEIDNAIRDYQDEMVRTGKARIVNGKFYKLA